MRAVERARVLAVKRGEVPREDVLAEVGRLEVEIRRLLDTGQTPLPTTADLPAVTDWMIHAQRRHWGW
jgi:hypothetical protein